MSALAPGDRVLVTRRLAPGVLDPLARACRVTLHDDDLPMRRDQLLAAAAGCAALLATLDDVVDQKLLRATGPGCVWSQPRGRHAQH
jgi:glyoxylate reductase